MTKENKANEDQELIKMTLEEAEAEAKLIKEKAENEAEKIINEAKKKAEAEADKIIKGANNDFKKIKSGSYVVCLGNIKEEGKLYKKGDVYTGKKAAELLNAGVIKKA